jgi:hypothetical protein
MKIYMWLMFLPTIIASITGSGQTSNTKSTTTSANVSTTNTSNKINKAATNLNATNASLNNANSSMASSIEAANNLKATLSTVLGAKKSAQKEDVTIVIGNIEFEDADLTTLIAKLKEAKGVKEATSKFADGTATIQVHYKNSASELWGGLPDNAKALFKVVSMEDKGIALQHKKSSKDASVPAKQ